MLDWRRNLAPGPFHPYYVNAIPSQLFRRTPPRLMKLCIGRLYVAHDCRRDALLDIEHIFVP